jgi:AraC-like DNA-binding protein
MWAGFSTSGIIGLFVSCNAVIVGLAAMRRASNRNRFEKTTAVRFALLLICAGVLLGLFTVIYHGIVPYRGTLRLVHDLAALLFGLLVLDYVRCSLKRPPLGIWLAAPLLIYTGSWYWFPETVFLRVGIVHLILFGLCCVVMALSTYLTCQFRSRTAKRVGQRIPAIEGLIAALFSFYVVQVIYLLNPASLTLYLVAPVLGAAFIGLYFVIFLFTPDTAQAFLGPRVARHNGSRPETLARFSDIIKNREVFTDNDLSLDKLARILGHPARQVSQVINSESGKSFKQFINEFRVDKAKSLLNDQTQQSLSIEVIALLCGFRSRSTFYEVFRKETGMSPGDFRSRSR